jgi:hypothetical protein
VLLLDRCRLPKNGALFAPPPRVELAAFAVKLYRNDDPAIVDPIARFVLTPIINTAYDPIPSSAVDAVGAAAEVQVVPLDVNTLPFVPGATT